jgi:L-ascorbate metabolism protein UlaG (beta-lactamase superfamily)
MSDEKLFLRPNVVMEPLIDQWYAWAHLIAPATAAMNISERHMKIMQSYIKTPDVHAAAVKNPAMLGGPFIDYQGKRIEEIKDLMERTRTERAQMFALYQAIKELDELLRNEAVGFSLESLYKKIPEILRGYVELVYDLNNQPSFRLLEALLYKSDFYDSSAQSMMLSLINHDDRSFVLSTPRLQDKDDIHLRLPFDHEGIDELFRMRTNSQTFSFIKQALEFDDSLDSLFKPLLTPDPSAQYSGYDGSGLRWRYFGHACVLLETATTSILVDPVLSYSYDTDVPRYTYSDLPAVIDYVLITHNHQDHMMFETLLQLRHKISNIVVPRNGNGSLQDPSLRLMLENIGFMNVRELDEMEEIQTKAGSITGLPFLGEHADLSIRTKIAYRVCVNGHTLLFAADSCNIDPYLYRHISRILGNTEVLFLGMECDGAPLSWVYGPLLTRPLERKKDQSRRLSGSNFERAIEIINALKCKEVYVYAMGQEPWLNYVMSKKYTDESNPIIASNKLIEECRKQGILSERLFGAKEVILS